MLHLDNLSKRFGDIWAVNGVSLTIPLGQMVGIIGRSGAGKSTLLRLINRLVEPTSGTVHYHARPISSLRGRALRQWRAQCALIFQQFNLVPRLDVITNVLIGRLYHTSALRSLLNVFPPVDRARAWSATTCGYCAGARARSAYSACG